MTTTADLSKYIDSSLKIARDRIAAFQAALDRDPIDAFECCESVVEHAARIRVFSAVKRHLDNGAFVADVVEVATREAVKGARFPRRSTSPTSNLAHQYITAAWGEIAAWAGGVL